MISRWSRWLLDRARFGQAYFAAGRFGGSVMYDDGAPGGPGGGGLPATAIEWGAGNGLEWGSGNVLTWG